MEDTSSLYERFLRTYQKGEVIVEEGTRGKEMFIIHHGRVTVLRKTETNEQQTIAVLAPGEFFGEMALIDQVPRSATAMADEDDTQLIVLDQPKFHYMVQQHPEFSLAIMRRLAEIIRGVNAQDERKG